MVSVKKAIFRAARSVGLTRMLSGSGWRRRRLVILCYHGFSLADEHLWRPDLYMTADSFRRRLDLLRALSAVVLSLDEAIERLYAGTLPPRAVVITFDDGFADFHLVAAPILREYRVPATVYLTTYYVERGLPVWNLLSSYLIWRARDLGPVDLRTLTTGEGTFDLRTEQGRKHAHDKFLQRWTDETTENKDRALDALAQRLALSIADLRDTRLLQLMTPAEVRAVSEQGVDVELHTHRHRVPTDQARFLGELAENAEAITRFTGRNPTHLCYPSGVYDRSHLPFLRSAGIRSATTCDVGLATRDTEPLLLPRFLDCESVSEEAFEGWVTGIAALHPRPPSTSAATTEP